LIAYVFHWPPSELYELKPEDIVFWYDRGRDILERQNGK